MGIILAKISLVLLNLVVFLFEEGWIIAMVAIFPFAIAVVLVTCLLFIFAATSSFLSDLACLPPLVEGWMNKKKITAQKRLNTAIKSSLWLSYVITAIVISPTLSAVMMQMSGVRVKQAYVFDFLFALISGAIWCCIYGSGILILKKIF